jgi:hypothetical protein
MRAYNLNQVIRILTEYNDEYDVPPGPRIPWYTANLARAVMNQSDEIDDLQRKLATLSDQFSRLCAATGWHILEGE